MMSDIIGRLEAMIAMEYPDLKNRSGVHQLLVDALMEIKQSRADVKIASDVARFEEIKNDRIQP